MIQDYSNLPTHANKSHVLLLFEIEEQESEQDLWTRAVAEAMYTSESLVVTWYGISGGFKTRGFTDEFHVRVEPRQKQFWMACLWK